MFWCCANLRDRFTLALDHLPPDAQRYLRYDTRPGCLDTPRSRGETYYLGLPKHRLEFGPLKGGGTDIERQEHKRRHRG